MRPARTASPRTGRLRAIPPAPARPLAGATPPPGGATPAAPFQGAPFQAARLPTVLFLATLVLASLASCGPEPVTAQGTTLSELEDRLEALRPTQRISALAGLASLGTDADPAVEAIRRALEEDEAPTVRRAAAKTLEQIGTHSARRALRATAFDSDRQPDARSAATAGLARLEPAATLAELLRIAAEHPGDVTHAALDDAVWKALPVGAERAELLVRLTAAVSPRQPRLATAITLRCGQLGEAARPLVEFVSSPATARVASATRAAALAAAGDAAALEACVDLASRTTAGRRETYYAAIARLGNDPELAERAATVLWQAATESTDPADSRAALEGLGDGLAGQLTPAAATRLAETLLAANRPDVRRAAGTALAATRPNEAQLTPLLPASSLASTAQRDLRLGILRELAATSAAWRAAVSRRLVRWWDTGGGSTPHPEPTQERARLDGLWRLGATLEPPLRDALLTRNDLPHAARRAREHGQSRSIRELRDLLNRPVAPSAAPPLAAHLATTSDGRTALLELVHEGPSAVRARCLSAVLEANADEATVELQVGDSTYRASVIVWPRSRTQSAGEQPADRALLYVGRGPADLRGAGGDPARPPIYLSDAFEVLASDGRRTPNSARAALVLPADSSAPLPATTVHGPLPPGAWFELR